jgi:hypothetical protein
MTLPRNTAADAETAQRLSAIFGCPLQRFSGIAWFSLTGPLHQRVDPKHHFLAAARNDVEMRWGMVAEIHLKCGSG